MPVYRRRFEKTLRDSPGEACATALGCVQAFRLSCAGALAQWAVLEVGCAVGSQEGCLSWCQERQARLTIP